MPRRRHRHLLHSGSLTAAVVAFVGCAHAGYRAPPAPLLEDLWIAPGLDERDSILYEAQIAASVFLVDNLVERERLLRNDQVSSGERVATRVFVMPQFRIRQLRDSSAAVRPPSFLPSVRFEQHFLRADTVPRTLGSHQRELRAFRDLGYRLEWTHHSNGQAGCFRQGYVPDASGEPDNCLPDPQADPPADPSGTRLNRANGDFSTTYWGLTLFARKIGVGSDQEERWALEGALGYQFHRFGIFGDMRDEQRDLYGTHRARLDVRARRSFGWVQPRIATLLEVSEHTHPDILNWRAHVDGSLRFERALGTGVFVRWLDGQDYYNIGFARRRTRVLIGLLLDPSALESPR